MQAVNKEVVVQEHDHQHDICMKPETKENKNKSKRVQFPAVEMYLYKIHWGS